MKLLTQINFNRLFLWLLILFLNFLVISKVNATPPASPYLPGETLDPLCAPTTTNCTVIPPIVSLNNLVTSTQFFNITSTGNDFQIISTGSQHIFYLPDASLISRGLVSTSSQIFAGNKFFADSLGVGVTSSSVKFQVNGNSILATTSISALTLTNPLEIFSGGTGLNSLGNANQILTVNNLANGLEYKNLSSLLMPGSGINIFGTATPTIENSGVLSLNSLTGTINLFGAVNQINVNTSSNSILLSLPQDINTSSSVVFRDLYLSNSLSVDINFATLTSDIILTPGIDKMYQFLTIATSEVTVYLATSTAKNGDSFVIGNFSGITSNSVIYVKTLGSSFLLDIITPYKISQFSFFSGSWFPIFGNNPLHFVFAREFNFSLSMGVFSYSNNYGISVGHSAQSNTSSNAIGFAAQAQNYSSAIGEYVRAYNYGVSIGYQSGYNLDSLSASANTLLGAYAGYRLTTGSGNIIIGYQAGYDSVFAPTVGSKNILIGFQAGTPATTTSNFLNIGNLIFATGINTATGSAVSSGNVGIGTTTPSARLTVAGDGFIGGQLTVFNTTSLATTTFASLNSNILFTPEKNFLINILPSYSTDTSGADLTILGATSSVSSSSAVRGGNINLLGGNADQTVTSSARGGSINIIGGKGGIGGLSIGGSINIQSGPGLKSGDISIIATTSVGVGNINIITGNSSLSSNSGNINITAGSAFGTGQGGSVIISAGTSSSGLAGNIIFRSNVTELMRITTNSVAIGTTTPSARLTVAGDILQTNALNCNLSADATGKIICAPSSLKYKENITPLSFNKDQFLSLTPKEFEFKKDLPFNLPGKQVGFIAEEVAQQFPDLVRFNNDQPEGIKYENLSIYLYQLLKDFLLNINYYVSDALKSFGVIIQEHMLSVKEIITQNLTANYIISPKIKTEFLEMKDKITGEQYCLFIAGGEIQKFKGDCSNINQNLFVNDNSNQNTNQYNNNSADNSNIDLANTNVNNNSSNTSSNTNSTADSTFDNPTTTNVISSTTNNLNSNNNENNETTNSNADNVQENFNASNTLVSPSPPNE